MDRPYQFKNLENQGQNIGTVEAPYFFNISAGENDHKSLLYYAQIAEKYYMYRINQVNQTTLNLHCKDRSCPARALAQILPETGIIREHPVKRSNGKRLKRQFRIDFADPKVRILENYSFVPKNSLPHNVGCLGVCPNGILEHAKKIFRETHCTLGLRTGRNQVDSVLESMAIGRNFGIQTESKILGCKRNELQSYYDKNLRKNGYSTQFQVPHQFRSIFESPENSMTHTVQNSVESKFLQFESENFVAFFLSK